MIREGMGVIEPKLRAGLIARGSTG
jgi:hypothetical protein